VCALKAIKALDEAFAMEYVVNMIYGRPTPQITMYRHEGLMYLPVVMKKSLISGIH
jgi:ATP-dependent DNA helicase RecQ